MLALLQRAHELSLRAMQAGHHPFGALLVAPDHATVLLEQGNVDSVNHAEAVLAREASRRFAPEERAKGLLRDVRIFRHPPIPHPAMLI